MAQELVKPIIDLAPRYVVPGNFFPSLVEQDTKTVDLFKLALKHKPKHRNNRRQDDVPNHHFHLNISTGVWPALIDCLGLWLPLETASSVPLNAHKTTCAASRAQAKGCPLSPQS
jgi:hypothetical protein